MGFRPCRLGVVAVDITITTTERHSTTTTEWGSNTPRPMPPDNSTPSFLGRRPGGQWLVNSIRRSCTDGMMCRGRVAGMDADDIIASSSSSNRMGAADTVRVGVTAWMMTPSAWVGVI